MVATGNDFEELRNLARSQDASKQAQLALERANKEKQEAQRRAQQDAREKAEREKARQVLKLREEQKRRREEEEEKLALKRKEWQRQRQEQLERAAKEAKAGKAKVVTKKMIGQRERVGLGKGTSGKSSTSSYEHLPLTRQEKRDRREREALGLSIRQSKATPGATPKRDGSAVAGPSRIAASAAATVSSSKSGSTPPRSSKVPHRSPSNGSGPFAASPLSASKAGPSRSVLAAASSPTLHGLEAELEKAKSDREHYEALSETKENLAKLRIAEAAERELRRRVAMERKRQESKELAKIRGGAGGAGDAESASQGNGETSALARKPETAREKFMREEAERKAAKQASTSLQGSKAKASKKSMDFDESLDEESEDYDDDYDDDGFIDDGEDDKGYDIWSIMNPGKDKSKYFNRAIDSDDDMEADADTVWREEMRSARQGRQDDRREEELLRRHEEEKAARKKRKLSAQGDR